MYSPEERKRIKKLVDSVEVALRELLLITDEKYISSFVFDGAFMIYTEHHNGKQKLDVYRREKENE